MDRKKLDAMMRIAREHPHLRKAALNLMREAALRRHPEYRYRGEGRRFPQRPPREPKSPPIGSDFAWWVNILTKKVTTRFDQEGSHRNPGKWVSEDGKKRFRNLEQVFRYLARKLGHLKDLRYARHPSKKQPNSVEIWGERTYVDAGIVVKEDHQIFITKGGRVSPEEQLEMKKRFNRWNVRGVFNLTEPRQRQIVYERPVGEFGDWSKDPAIYSGRGDWHEEQSRGMTPKEQKRKELEDLSARLPW
jgi:hypothetical protein